MTPDQWRDLARFAGVELVDMGIGAPCLRLDRSDGTRGWRQWDADTDWNDFGPLWVKLKHWRSAGNYFEGTPKYLALPMECRHAWIDFGIAEITGDEKRIMQAGCLLGAAIGATMRQEEVE